MTLLVLALGCPFIYKLFSWVRPLSRTMIGAECLTIIHLALLSAGSPSLDEIVVSLYTLVVTNLAMAVTALILGYKHVREITLQEYV